ncbi:uncharacterized protein LOC114541031 [Dendronephthya gigantea]|uniref:uncharacterized protein LOC114541031 n=1 Tax=Dendronephthya gigantea TaxID=151771 RepID=UPI00106D7CA5|nr:uncharacterized protein LOC114541031 [Dendronephthya gigantea]
MLTVEDVQSWLIEVGFDKYCQTFKDNMIDGEALQSLTERTLELLIPIIGVRIKFLKLNEEVKRKNVVLVENENCDLDEGASTSSAYHKNPPVTPENARKPTAVSSPSDVPCNAKKLWPGKVSLPQNFRPELARALAAKDPKVCVGKLRRAFVMRIYEHFSVYTLYPTRDQLTQICLQIVREYPFLKDKSVGSGHINCYVYMFTGFMVLADLREVSK